MATMLRFNELPPACLPRTFVIGADGLQRMLRIDKDDRFLMYEQARNGCIEWLPVPDDMRELLKEQNPHIALLHFDPEEQIRPVYLSGVSCSSKDIARMRMRQMLGLLE